MKKIFALIGAGVLVALGVAGTVAVTNEEPAQAAVCTYSNLTSKSVKNVNCNSGAYGYKDSANATTGHQVGAWVSPGNYSKNPDPICYTYPTMVRK